VVIEWVSFVGQTSAVGMQKPISGCFDSSAVGASFRIPQLSIWKNVFVHCPLTNASMLTKIIATYAERIV